MNKLRLDDFQVDSFATDTAQEDSAPAAAITVMTAPYSMLGSCYGCPSEVTVCAFTVAADPAA